MTMSKNGRPTRSAIRILLAVGSWTCWAPSLVAQPMTNQDIVKMVKAKVPEKTIVTAVLASQPSFDTSPDELIRLHNAGIPSKVVNAMISAGSRIAGPATVASSTVPPAAPAATPIAASSSAAGPSSEARAIASAAAPDPVRTDPTENITVFTADNGTHTVTLVRETLHVNIDQVINAKEYGGIRERNFSNGDREFLFGAYGAAFADSYWIRTRVVDGRPICEKFAIERKKEAEDPAEAAARAGKLFAESCTSTDGVPKTTVHRARSKAVPY